LLKAEDTPAKKKDKENDAESERDLIEALMSKVKIPNKLPLNWLFD
jgi:hypothetical protein